MTFIITSPRFLIPRSICFGYDICGVAEPGFKLKAVVAFVLLVLNRVGIQVSQGIELFFFPANRRLSSHDFKAQVFKMVLRGGIYRHGKRASGHPTRTQIFHGDSTPFSLRGGVSYYYDK